MEASAASGRPWRIVRDFSIGLCLGGIAAAVVWHAYPGFWKAPPEQPLEVALQQRESLREQAQALRDAAVDSTPSVLPVAAEGPCDFEPLMPPSNAADGHVRLEHPFPASPRAKAKVFLRAASAAAASGRKRDEESALIAACRHNAQASSAPTIPLAVVLASLGERYAAAAAVEPSAGLRERLLSRARDVLGKSAEVYAGALGPNAAKSREMRQRLATLDRDVAVAADMAGAENAARTVQAEEAKAPARTSAARKVQAKAPKVPSPKVVRARSGTAGPSPDPEPRTRQAVPQRERADAMTQSDVELRQLASDLARLRAQAEAVSDDPDGLRHRAALADGRRAQCRDTACLKEWYARRRQELLAEF